MLCTHEYMIMHLWTKTYNSSLQILGIWTGCQESCELCAGCLHFVPRTQSSAAPKGLLCRREALTMAPIMSQHDTVVKL